MSRYRIPGHKAEHLVIVGWDSPLETFFLQVDDASLPDEADHCLCWLGTAPGELASVEALATALSPYALLSEDDAHRLQRDYEQRTAPTPLQRRMRRLLQHGTRST